MNPSMERERNSNNYLLKVDISRLEDRISSVEGKLSKIETYFLLAMAIFNVVLGPLSKLFFDWILTK